MASLKAPPVAKSVPSPPNQTLYVWKLPSKISKQDLKTSLYMLFSTYGPVLDIVALKTMKMRGQAHIVYRDTQHATQALRALDGSLFLGQNLRIAYARSKSNYVAKLDGTYKMPGSAAATVEMTDAQHSIFNAPAPGTSAVNGRTTPQSLPAKPPAPESKPQSTEPRGQKRSREEDEEKADDSDEDVAMEEDSDDD